MSGGPEMEPLLPTSAPPQLQMDDGDSVAANKVFFGAQKKDNAIIGSTPFDYCLPFSSCFILPERTNIVELYFGAYHGTITEPGCYVRNALVVEMRKISTALQTLDMAHIKVIDARGSPLIVSGIVTFEIVDARRAAIDVVDPVRYVHDMAPAVLKRIVSQFPFEASSANPHEICLRTGAEEVGRQMRDALQRRCTPAGVRIELFALNELSYSREIAQVMLKRQQAEALIDARRSIVKGAKEIAIQTVEDVGEKVLAEDRSKLLSNLLIVLVGDHEVTPTLPLAGRN